MHARYCYLKDTGISIISLEKEDGKLQNMWFGFSFLDKAKKNTLAFTIEYKPLYKKDILGINITPYFELPSTSERITQDSKKILGYSCCGGVTEYRSMKREELEMAVEYLSENLPEEFAQKFNMAQLMKRYENIHTYDTDFRTYYWNGDFLGKDRSLPDGVPEKVYNCAVLKHTGPLCGDDNYYISLDADCFFILKSVWNVEGKKDYNPGILITTPDEVNQIVHNMQNEFSPEGIAQFGIDKIKERYSAWAQTLNKPLAQNRASNLRNGMEPKTRD